MESGTRISVAYLEQVIQYTGGHDVEMVPEDAIALGHKQTPPANCEE